MVSQKYRWDFIGLSTDEKPTSETSDKVVNGSTYYCSDTSKLYIYCDGAWYERKPLGGGGGGGGTSNFNELSNRPKYNGSEMTGSTNIPEVKSYTAGTNISISDQNVISATDTTYSAFTGTDGTAAGTAGLVPAPATTDAGKFLKADGTWGTAGGGGGPTVVQTTGTSTTDVMSQKATSDMVYVPGYDPVTAPSTWAIGLGKYNYAVAGPSFTVGRADSGNFRTRTFNDLAINILGSDNIGRGSITLGGGSHNSNGDSWNIAIGADASTGGHSTNNVVLGTSAASAYSANGAIALGSYSSATHTGEMNIGSTNTSYGYNSSNYRLLTGLYDPQSAHDAVNKQYVDPTTDSSAPTTATVGRLGQIQIDTTTATAYMCVEADDVTPSYTWKQITG